MIFLAWNLTRTKLSHYSRNDFSTKPQLQSSAQKKFTAKNLP